MNNQYNKNLKTFSRELRSETVSRAEKYLWKSLLSRKQTGLSFKRQRPILNYIVDFFCAEIGLIIEIDGNSHVNKGEYDRTRENNLRNFGYEILRFKEGEVLNQMEMVDEKIRHAIYCLSTKN